MKRSEAEKVYKLLEEEFRAEIIARLGWFPSGSLEFGDYYMEAIKRKNEIRELIFGSSDLVKMGKKWGLLKQKDEKKKSRKGSKKRRKTKGVRSNIKQRFIL